MSGKNDIRKEIINNITEGKRYITKSAPLEIKLEKEGLVFECIGVIKIFFGENGNVSTETRVIFKKEIPTSKDKENINFVDPKKAVAYAVEHLHLAR